MPRSVPAYTRPSGGPISHALFGFDHVGGYRFRVGPGGYRVDRLGYEAEVPMLSPIPVAIFDEQDRIVVQAEVTGEEPVDDCLRWCAIDPIDLTPGLTYRLGAFMRRGHPALEFPPLSLVDDLEDLGACYAAASSLEERFEWEYAGSKRCHNVNMGGYSPRPMAARHREIVGLAAEGLTDKEIAARLGIGVATIDTYWKRLRETYGVASRTAVVARALETLYRQANRTLALQREETIAVYASKARDDEAKALKERDTLGEIARLKAENARLRHEASWAIQALQAVEASGLIVYDEERRWCTDNIRQLGIDPILFRAGEITVSDRIRSEDVRPFEGAARIRAFRIVRGEGDEPWMLEIRDADTTACALILDHLNQIAVEDQAKLFEYLGESALAMWRRRAVEVRRAVKGYRINSPFEEA